MSPLRTIWLSLMVAVLAYGVAALMARPVGTGSLLAAITSNAVVLAMYVLAVSSLAASLIVPRLVPQRQPATILRLVLTEAVAIFGLVAAILGDDSRLFAPLGLVSLVAMALAFPSSEPAAPAR